VFERFSEPARQSVVYAQEEARDLGHASIGTEHLLLGLLREDGVAARALEALEITLDDTRAAVERLAGRGDVPGTGQIPFTPGAKQTLELALREALNLGHQLIATEHILLGLTRVADGVTGQIFRERGLNDRLVRGVVAKLIVRPEPPGVVAGYRLAYRVVELGDAEALTVELLNELAADRWELVTVFGAGEGVRAVFKRLT
jgi:ATP-dependent Clp protease ATP-binding subunit ClpC